MWSPHYFYFNIRKDNNLSGRIRIKELNDILDSFSQLRKISRYNYRNAEHFPWIDIVLPDAADPDNWSFDGSKKYKEINLIAVTGSKILDNTGSLEERHKIYIEFLSSIRDQLGWELVEETGED